MGETWCLREPTEVFATLCASQSIFLEGPTTLTSFPKDSVSVVIPTLLQLALHKLKSFKLRDTEFRLINLQRLQAPVKRRVGRKTFKNKILTFLYFFRKYILTLL